MQDRDARERDEEEEFRVATMRSSMSFTGLSMSSFQSDLLGTEADQDSLAGLRPSQTDDEEGEEEDEDEDKRLRLSMSSMSTLRGGCEEENGEGTEMRRTAEDADLSDERSEGDPGASDGGLEGFGFGSDDQANEDEKGSDLKDSESDAVSDAQRDPTDPEQRSLNQVERSGDFKSATDEAHHVDENDQSDRARSGKEPPMAADAERNDSDKKYVQVQPIAIARAIPVAPGGDDQHSEDTVLTEQQQETRQYEPPAVPPLEHQQSPSSAPSSDDRDKTDNRTGKKQSESDANDDDELAALPAPPEPATASASYSLRDLFPVVYEKPTLARKQKKHETASSTLERPPSTTPAADRKQHPSQSQPLSATTNEQSSSRLPQQESSQRVRSLHEQLDTAQSQLKTATQTIRMHHMVEAEKKQLAQRNARLKQQFEVLTADLQRTKAENARLHTENELYAAKLPQLQAELLEESCHADEKQAQSVQMQLSIAQLKARVHVLQTRNGNVETQKERVQAELRECKKELRRKTATLQATSEKLAKLETDMSSMKTVHAQEMLQWKTRLATTVQRFEVEKVKLESETSKKMVQELRDAKAHAAKVVKKKKELDVLVAKLEDELKHSKRDADAQQREMCTHVKQVRSFEKLLRQSHRIEASLRNQVATLQAKAKRSMDEESREIGVRARRGEGATRSQSRFRGPNGSDPALFPLDLLLLSVDTASDEDGDDGGGGNSTGDGHHCRCCSVYNASLLGGGDDESGGATAASPAPQSCRECEEVRDQLRDAHAEIQRLRVMHANELKVQTMAYARSLALKAALPAQRRRHHHQTGRMVHGSRVDPLDCSHLSGLSA